MTLFYLPLLAFLWLHVGLTCVTNVSSTIDITSVQGLKSSLTSVSSLHVMLPVYTVSCICRELRVKSSLILGKVYYMEE